MPWISTTQKLPALFVKVWVMTDSGKKTTAYLKSNSEWHLLCRKIAAEKPGIIQWEEPH